MGVLTSIAELIAKGFPEEVAQRIASGELPMDEASRLARASDQGYGGVLYRGHAEGNPPRSNQDMFMSDQQIVADTYARGGEYYDEATDSYKMAQGSTVPLRTNANNLLVKDADGLDYDEVTLAQSDVPDMAWSDYQRTTDKTDGIAEAVKNEGTRQGVLFRDIMDDFDGLGENQSNVYNILGSRPDVNIRSPSAAFDPQYKGSNIMGGALAAGVGLGALSQSEDADAGGATSLVQLILKKFGNDADGATQELVRMGGFPESVARRIATGELPMDEASRVARREAQTHPETYIHGSKSGGILEIDPEKSGATNPNARGSGFWGSDNPYQAGTYTGALGEGGTLYPFRVKRGEQIDVDLNGSHWNNIDTEARVTSNGEDFGSIEGWDDTAYDTNDLSFMFQDAGADSLLMRNTIDTAADGNVSVVFEEMFPELKKMPHGSKERYDFQKSISSEDFQKARDIANERSARPSNNVAVFDENNVRSPNAAFDPQYNGPNIMGNADPRLLAGTAAGTALGALAAPMVKDSGHISSPRAGWLWDVTMGLRDVERRLEGSPAELMFPTGLVDYLETTNRREEKPNAETAAWALMDVFPW